MRTPLLLILATALISCTPEALMVDAEPFQLWQPPRPTLEPGRLRVEPPRSAARLGESATLRVAGSDAANAECMTTTGVSTPDPTFTVLPRRNPGTVDVLCTAGTLQAHAQVTFVESATLPVADPYGGGVALFKLRRLERHLESPVGTRRTGLRSVDAKLRRLRAWAMPAFPFDRKGARDYVGLDHWVAIDIPEGVNFYQAVALLRTDPGMHAESYTPEDGAYLRVKASSDWPAPLQRVVREGGPRELGDSRYRRIIDHNPAAAATWDLEALQAPAVWTKTQGEGLRIGVVDTGIDVNHAALAPNLMAKTSERLGDDVDGNGVPGDENGINTAHLAIAFDDTNVNAPRLALGVMGDVSDWHDLHADEHRAGRGTLVASLAAGAGGAGGRLGVAPRAEILAVDVQENLRTSASRLFHSDPRMRETVSLEAPLRSSVWARASGVVYATAERSRVLACAWGDDNPSWLLHDALLYAEDNCAIPVCASSEEGAYPGNWRRDWLSQNETGTGAVRDAWTGQTQIDFFRRPLRATLLVDAREGSRTSNAQADLRLPTMQGKRGLLGASSNPRNDAQPAPDRRTASFSGAAAATGLVAGAAALVTATRPDLEPWAIRAALLESAGADQTPALPAAIAAAQGQPEGPCQGILNREELPQYAKPWWQRIKVKASMKGPNDETPPASPGLPPRLRAP